jgi:hypothetical protein
MNILQEKRTTCKSYFNICWSISSLKFSYSKGLEKFYTKSYGKMSEHNFVEMSPLYVLLNFEWNEDSNFEAN